MFHSAIRRAGQEVMPEAARRFERVVLEQAGPAVAAGLDPAAPEAAAVLVPIVDAVRGEKPDTPELRTEMADRFALGPTAASSATGGCSASSTAGRRSRP